MVFGLFFQSQSLAMATDYYVAKDGSDGDPGTLADPWLTVQYAVNHVTAGDTIYVRTGTYNESVGVTGVGTSESPITLTNYNDELVTLDGGTSRAFAPRYPSGYWIVDGLHFTSSATLTVEFASWSCSGTCQGLDYWTFRNNHIIGSVKIYGAYNLFENNEVDGTTNDGSGNAIHTHYDVSHHNTFRGNTIHNFTRRGIWSMHRTHDDLIEDNTLYNIGDMAIDPDGYGNVEWRHTIRNNTIYDSSTAITLENCFDCVVENNIIRNMTKGGITMINYGDDIPYPDDPNYLPNWPVGARCAIGGESNQYGDLDSDNDCEGDDTNGIIRQNVITDGGNNGSINLYHVGGVKVEANSIYGGEKWAVRLQGDEDNDCNTIELTSNIFSMNGEAEISVMDYACISVNDYNIVGHTSPTYIYQRTSDWSHLSQAQYVAAYGMGQNTIQTDPLFVDAANNNLHLSSGSPAINAGIDVGLTGDYDGVARPQGAGFDAGAYEYLSITPLTVTINQMVGQSDPTNVSPINFLVIFSGSVTNFVTGDVALSGTAGATTATVTGVGTSYVVAVSGMTGSGTVIASVNAGVASDGVGTTNSASTSTDNTVTWDVSGPTLNSITIDDTLGYTNSETPEIHSVSSGEPTHIAFSCNGGTNWSSWITYADYVSTFNITTGATGCTTTNGSKTISAKLKDIFDNESSSVEDTTYYDTTGPTGSITNSSGDPTVDPTPILDLTIADSGIGETNAWMRFSCNNSDWTDWENYMTPKTNFNIKPGVAAYGCETSAGSRTVYAQFRDVLNNIGPSYNTGSFVLGNGEGPVATISSSDTNSFVLSFGEILYNNTGTTLADGTSVASRFTSSLGIGLSEAVYDNQTITVGVTGTPLAGSEVSLLSGAENNFYDDSLNPGGLLEVFFDGNEWWVNPTTLNVGATYFTDLITTGQMSVGGSAPETATSLTSENNFIITIGSSGTNSEVGLTLGTVISELDDGEFDANTIAGSVVDISSISGLEGYVAVGAIQWGIPGTTMKFNQPIAIRLYLGTDFDGQTLNIYRSPSLSVGWTSSGLSATTCTILSGYCNFTATQASYYVAAAEGDSSPAPTVVPTSTPNNNSSSQSVSNNNEAPRCNDSFPIFTPDLFKIKTTRGSAKIVYTPVRDKITGYAVMYGLKKGDERYAALISPINNNEGEQSFTINKLNPKTTYYFKVAAINGCVSGPWSEWIPAKADRKKEINKYKTVIKNKIKVLVNQFK